MKKPLLYIIVFVIIVCGTLYILYAQRSSVVEPVVEQNTSEVATTTQEVSPIVVTSLAQNVQIKENYSESLTEVKSTATTTSGSTVKTSSSGRALIEDTEKRVVLDFNSELTIATPGPKQTTIQLIAGTVWSRIQKVFEQGEFYEVKTQNTVAAVRGTTFNVSYIGDTTTIIVTEGTVAVAPIDPATGNTDTTKTVLVPAGYKAVRKGTGPIVVSPYTKAEVSTPWFVFNKVSFNTQTPTTQPRTTTPNATTPTPTPTPTATTTPQLAPTPTPAPTPSVFKIKSVSPNRVAVYSTETITLSGTGILRANKLTLSRSGATPVNLFFTSKNDTTMTFSLTQEVQPGTYDITVTSTETSSGQFESSQLSQALTVFYEETFNSIR